MPVDATHCVHHVGDPQSAELVSVVHGVPPLAHLIHSGTFIVSGGYFLR